jgi:hypothetical protein
VQGRFLPTETFITIKEWLISECLNNDAKNNKFEIFTRGGNGQHTGITVTEGRNSSNKTLQEMGLIPAAILYLKWISDINVNNELESNIEHMCDIKKSNNYGYYLNPTLMLTPDSKSNNSNGIELQSMYPEGKQLIPNIIHNTKRSDDNSLNLKSPLSDEITNTSEPKKGSGKPKWLKI